MTALSSEMTKPARPAWGVAPIRCGKTKCKWRGHETDLVPVPHKRIDGMTSKVCPMCGCESYMFMTEREIALWKRSTEKTDGIVAMAKLIEAAPVTRDETGEWHHPGQPTFDEGEEAKWREWIEEQGLTLRYSWLESEDAEDPAYVSYFDNEDTDFSSWMPAAPEGQGWFTLGIWDSEDGPVWCWARRVEGSGK